MNRRIFGAVGLSGLLMLGSAPGIVLAHEGHDHGTRHRSSYSNHEEEETGRYTASRENDRRDEAYDEEEENDAQRSSSRRSRGPDQDYSAPRLRHQRSSPR